MKRKDILNSIKGLDESNVFPYFYGVITDGSDRSEDWLDRMEEKHLTSEDELIAEIEEFSQARR
jgi:hypothetical protein